MTAQSEYPTPPQESNEPPWYSGTISGVFGLWSPVRTGGLLKTLVREETPRDTGLSH